MHIPSISDRTRYTAPKTLNKSRKEATMKQSKLISKLYQACLDHDEKAIHKLRALEFKKIFKHRAENKRFGSKWALVRI